MNIGIPMRDSTDVNGIFGASNSFIFLTAGRGSSDWIMCILGDNKTGESVEHNSPGSKCSVYVFVIL